MQFLGDILVVEHIGKNIKSSVIHIPDDVRSKSGGIEARVLYIGSKFRYKDFVMKDSVVIVPEHLGSRGRIPDEPNAIVYDGEDILGIIAQLHKVSTADN